MAWSFKGFTGNAATEHLSRLGDLHTYGESVSTKMVIFVEGSKNKDLAGAA